jgi:hypothetical protein
MNVFRHYSVGIYMQPRAKRFWIALALVINCVTLVRKWIIAMFRTKCSGNQPILWWAEENDPSSIETFTGLETLQDYFYTPMQPALPEWVQAEYTRLMKEKQYCPWGVVDPITGEIKTKIWSNRFHQVHVDLTEPGKCCLL